MREEANREEWCSAICGQLERAAQTLCDVEQLALQNLFFLHSRQAGEQISQTKTFQICLNDRQRAHFDCRAIRGKITDGWSSFN